LVCPINKELAFIRVMESKREEELVSTYLGSIGYQTEKIPESKVKKRRNTKCGGDPHRWHSVR